MFTRLKKLFGYAVAKDSLSRSPAVTSLTSVDRELNPHDRKKAISRSREIEHEFSIVKWALRKHVDYNSRLFFQSQTDIPELDNKIENIISNWSEQGNFEVTGRHTLNEFMRITEACRTIDGDVGVLKLEDGRLQGIEGDRILNPNGVTENRLDWVHGVKTNEYGAAVGYAIHARKHYGDFEFEREVEAKNLILHGYFDRFDQVRGVGLLTSAANTFKDVYDSFDYSLAKSKALALFGLKFKRADGTEPLGRTQKDEQEKRDAQRRLELKGKGSYLIELEQGEDLESIQDNQPSDQFQNYTKLMIMVALKSLDIYYSMFDESHTNFYGSRAGITQYIESCKPKRESNRNFLKHITRWKLAREVMAGRLVLPGEMTVNDLWFDWIPAGLPWWKPSEEAKGLSDTIQFGFDSYSGVCRSLGKEFRDIVDERKKDEEYARRNGIILPTLTEKPSSGIEAQIAELQRKISEQETTN